MDHAQRGATAWSAGLVPADDVVPPSRLSPSSGQDHCCNTTARTCYLIESGAPAQHRFLLGYVDARIPGQRAAQRTEPSDTADGCNIDSARGQPVDRACMHNIHSASDGPAEPVFNLRSLSARQAHKMESAIQSASLGCLNIRA